MLCILCNSECKDNLEFSDRDRFSYSRELYNIYKCKKCSSLVISPLPSQENIEIAFTLAWDAIKF